MKKNIYSFFCSFLFFIAIFSVSHASTDNPLIDVHTSLRKILNECKAGIEKSKSVMSVTDLQTGKTLSTGRERIVQLKYLIDDLKNYLDTHLSASAPESQSPQETNLLKKIKHELNAASKQIEAAVEFSEKAREAENMDFLFHYEKKFNKSLKEIQNIITYADQLTQFDKRR